LLREYELFYIVRPDVDEEQVRTTMDEVAALVAGHGGEVTKSSLWGRRRLAYTIAGFTDGYYTLKEISLPAEKLRDLERQLILDERVIRQLITLRQVYYLPEDEDRRGRVRTRSRDRAAQAEGAAAVPDEDDSPDIQEEDNPGVDLEAGAAEVGAAEDASPDEQASGEE
jgi:small subunit ribosomal protein S6